MQSRFLKVVVSLIALLVLVSLLQLTGCRSSSPPSEDQARKVAENSYQNIIHAGAKIIDFRKQNGETKEIEGQQFYVYHFLVAFELPSGIGWAGPTITSTGGFVVGAAPQRGGAFGFVPKIDAIPKGTTGVGRGTITFGKTEKGWISRDLPDHADSGYCGEKQPQACYKALGWDKLQLQ